MATRTKNAPQALYRRIADELSAKVQKGAYGERLPTLQQLADDYGVGMITVRRAIAVLQEEGVVTAAPGRGIQPTRLRRGRTNTLGLVVGETKAPLGSCMAEGFSDECRANAQAVAAECYGGDFGRQRELVQGLVEERQVDGLVLWLVDQPAGLCDWAVDYLRKERTPFVLVPDADTGRYANCHTVSNAESGAAADVMTHLIARGRRSIRFVGSTRGKALGYERHRYERYRRSMEVAGLEPSARLVYSTGSRFIAQLRKCDAVFCATDHIACAVLRACLAAGIRVPVELAVAGYDNLEAAELFGLTTVEQHFERIGSEAVRILLDEIEGRITTPQHRTVASELVVRSSTVPARG